MVCLQEIWESERSANTAEWIVAHLRQLNGTGLRWRPLASKLVPDPTVVFGSAILSRWPIEEHHHWLLPLAADPDDVVSAMPWELLHAQTAGVDIFSTHLAPAPHHGNHRAVQVLAIDEHIRQVRGNKDALVQGRRPTRMPPIPCGDFNAEPDSDEIRFLSSLTSLDGRTTFYQDAWRVAGDGPGYTQDWRTNPIAASLNVHRKRIDYIFVGDPFLRQEHAGRVLSAAHLATWQIGFGVGLLVAAWMSRLTHAMLALAVTLAGLTVVATLIDILNGHRGPLAELVHLVELVGVALPCLRSASYSGGRSTR